MLCVEPPTGEWKDRIAPFLSHKGQPWNWQIERHLEAPADEMEARFYVALCDEVLISHIMTAEFAGIATLSHVFTNPERRGLGAASILMGALCDDFRRRGGVVMHLGTRYEGNAWRIYQRFGFEGVRPPKGLMRWVANQQRYEQLYAAGQAGVRAVQWQDWPLLHALLLEGRGDWLRSRTLRAYGVASVEGSFLELMQKVSADQAGAWALAVPGGATVGLASLAPFADVPSEALQLDVYVHPNFERQLDELLSAVELPNGRSIISYLDGASVERQRVLEQAGFGVTCKLKGFCQDENTKCDLVILVRE